jgi:hypothetical protein
MEGMDMQPAEVQLEDAIAMDQRHGNTFSSTELESVVFGWVIGRVLI